MAGCPERDSCPAYRSSHTFAVQDMVEHGRTPSKKGKPMPNADTSKGDPTRRQTPPRPNMAERASRSRSASPPPGAVYHHDMGLPPVPPTARLSSTVGVAPLDRNEFARQVADARILPFCVTVYSSR